MLRSEIFDRGIKQQTQILNGKNLLSGSDVHQSLRLSCASLTRQHELLFPRTQQRKATRDGQVEQQMSYCTMTRLNVPRPSLRHSATRSKCVTLTRTCGRCGSSPNASSAAGYDLSHAGGVAAGVKHRSKCPRSQWKRSSADDRCVRKPCARDTS